MLTVVIYSSQNQELPSLRLRLIEPLSLQERGVKLILASGYSRDGRYFLDSEAWEGADVVVIHRNFPTKDTMPLIRKIAASSVRLVYETDDAFELLPDDHPKAFHKACAPYINECVRRSNLVVVSTKELAKLYRDCAPVCVVPNTISQRIWGSHDGGTPRGSVSAESKLRVALVGGDDHLGDFLTVADVVREATFVDWVCYGNGAIRALRALGVEPVLSINSNFKYVSHPSRLRQLSVDVAVCPLLDNSFNRCKSDIKYIEFGYLGVPILAAALPGYSDSIVNCVNGFLCTNFEEWFATLSHLDRNREHCIEQGVRAREAVVSERLLQPENALLALFSNI